MPHRRASKRMVGAATCMLWALSAMAQTGPGDQPGSAAPSEQENPTPGQTGAGAPPQAPSPEEPTGLWQRATLLGDIGGLRSLLAAHGVSFGLNETSEVLGNVTGGVHRGADYDGLTLMSLGVDTGKAFGLPGGIFNVSALPRPQSQHRQSADAPDRQQHRGGTQHAALGTVVPTELPGRQVRRQNRPTKSGSGIHHQPGIEPVHQYHDGLAGTSLA